LKDVAVFSKRILLRLAVNWLASLEMYPLYATNMTRIILIMGTFFDHGKATVHLFAYGGWIIVATMRQTEASWTL
jgi:hypothetical protein